MLSAAKRLVPPPQAAANWSPSQHLRENPSILELAPPGSPSQGVKAPTAAQDMAACMRLLPLPLCPRRCFPAVGGRGEPHQLRKSHVWHRPGGEVAAGGPGPTPKGQSGSGQGGGGGKGRRRFPVGIFAVASAAALSAPVIIKVCLQSISDPSFGSTFGLLGAHQHPDGLLGCAPTHVM